MSNVKRKSNPILTQEVSPISRQGTPYIACRRIGNHSLGILGYFADKVGAYVQCRDFSKKYGVNTVILKVEGVFDIVNNPERKE